MSQNYSNTNHSLENLVNSKSNPQYKSPKSRTDRVVLYFVMAIGVLAIAIMNGRLIRQRMIRSNRVRAENASVVYEPNSLELTEPSHFEFIKGSECPRYARLAVKVYFGIEYEPSYAWYLAGKNRSVWKADHDPIIKKELSKLKISIDDLYNARFSKEHKREVAHMYDTILQRMIPNLQEGYLIGTFFSGSNFNRYGRPYTHILAYVGIDDNANHVVHHKYGEGPHASSLETDILHFPKDYSIKHGSQKHMKDVLIPREIIAPKH